jgi:hypothetical protein
MTIDDVFIFKAITRIRKLMSRNSEWIFGIYLTLFFASALLYFALDGEIVGFYFSAFEINFSSALTNPGIVRTIFVTFITLLALLMILPIVFTGLFIRYFTLEEINEAKGIKERINKFGERKRKYGIEL